MSVGTCFIRVITFTFYRLGFYVVVFVFVPWLFLSTPYRSCRGGTSFALSGKGCKALFGECHYIGVPEKPDRLFGEEEAQRSGELFRKENDKRSLC